MHHELAFFIKYDLFAARSVLFRAGGERIGIISQTLAHAEAVRGRDRVSVMRGINFALSREPHVTPVDYDCAEKPTGFRSSSASPADKFT